MTTWLVHLAITLVNLVYNLRVEQAKIFGEFKLQKNCDQSCL